jgi:hypothetical protein
MREGRIFRRIAEFEMEDGIPGSVSGNQEAEERRDFGSKA